MRHALTIIISIIFSALAAISASAQTVRPSESLSSLRSQLQKRPDSIRLRIQIAKLEYEQDNYKEVIELLNSYTDQLPQEGTLLLANAYSSLEDFRNEVRILTILATKSEDDYRWSLLLAQAHLKLANTITNPEKQKEMVTEAIQRLRQTVRAKPEFKPAFDQLLKVLLQQEANNEARELIIEGLRRFGKRAQWLQELCRLDAIDGYLEQASDHCRQSIKVSPKYPDHYVYLIQALYDMKDYTLAEKEASRAASRFPNSEFIQWAAGTIFLKRKNYPVATRYFTAAVKADPQSGRAGGGLAQSLFESDRAKEALPYFIRACNQDKSLADIFLASGAKLKNRGQIDLGNDYRREAYKCRP